jgi:hypothetical protein
MKITNKTGLPMSIVRAIQNDPYSVGESDFTATGLLRPPRLAALYKIHADEIEEDAIDRVWALLGQAVHVVLERAEEEQAEERLYAKLDNWVIGGRYDRMGFAGLERDDPFTSTVPIEEVETWPLKITDYKVTSAWALKYDSRSEDHAAQLNILVWLARKNGHNVTEASVVYILRDWSERDLSKDKSEKYPRAPIVEVDFAIWAEQEVEDFMRLRINEFVRADAAVLARSPLPECTPDERWVDKKTGMSRRCKRYCPVSKFCTQWAEEEVKHDTDVAL